MRTAVVALALFSAMALNCLAQTLELDRDDDGVTDQWYEMANGNVRAIRTDRNGDGLVDHIVRFDAHGAKTYEEYDFNHDELMDDFYFYERGVLIRQEIDSNFDELVDIWVYLHKGIYIKRYELDTDYDGKIDRIVDYDDA